MTAVFLSASVPLPSRHKKYHSTADVMAIREAIKALVVDIIPRGLIVFGGHPAITPLVSTLLADFFPDNLDRAILYQSNEFEGRFPAEVQNFPTVRYTPRSENGLNDSLFKMRSAMISEHKFNAAIFIGGMEGVVAEYEIFRKTHPNALVLPLATTGAAALEIYENGIFPAELGRTVSYSTVFRRMIP